jgi:hypothetical protein
VIKLLVACLTIAGTTYIYQCGNFAVEKRRAELDEFKVSPDAIMPTPTPEPPNLRF